MATNLSELGDKPLKDDVDFDNLGNQGMGAFVTIPPGPYRVKLPKLTLAAFHPVESSEHGARVSCRFDKDAPTMIVQSKTGKEIGEPYQFTVSNVPRKRGRADDPNAPVSSDMDFLLKALGATKRPNTNRGYAEELIKLTASGEATIGLDNEWSWRCREDKDIYVDDGNGGQTQIEGTKGCGARYYQNKVAKVPVDVGEGKVEMQFPERITCGGKRGDEDCGASLRAFSNPTNFRK